MGTREPVGSGRGMAVTMPEGRPLGAGPVAGREAVGDRVEAGAGMEVGAAESDDGGDAGDRPGMLMGKHFARRGWLMSCFTKRLVSVWSVSGWKGRGTDEKFDAFSGGGTVADICV